MALIPSFGYCALATAGAWALTQAPELLFPKALDLINYRQQTSLEARVHNLRKQIRGFITEACNRSSSFQFTATSLKENLAIATLLLSLLAKQSELKLFARAPDIPEKIDTLVASLGAIVVLCAALQVARVGLVRFAFIYLRDSVNEPNNPRPILNWLYNLLISLEPTGH